MDEKKIVKSHFELGECMSRGAQSSVFPCKLHFFDQSGEVRVMRNLVMKVFPKDDYRRLLEEVKKINHPNIEKILRIVQDDNLTYMLEHRYEKTLREYSPKIDPPIWRIARDIFDALTFLHCHKEIIHCDIKCNNILIDKGRGILIDFNNSVFAWQAPKKTLAVIEGMHPERVLGTDCFGNWSFEVDTWALGITLQETEFRRNILREAYALAEINNPDKRRYPNLLAPWETAKVCGYLQIQRMQFSQLDNFAAKLITFILKCDKATPANLDKLSSMIDAHEKKVSQKLT
jgi:serine/threonine protein kinase